MALTLISHFYNEEFLLPFWLRHHTALFDHAVLLDYASTDNSVAICQQLAPHWEVRPSLRSEFDAQHLDEEVQAIEREFSGWKMALNTTEFLMVPDLSVRLQTYETEGISCLGMDTVVLVDPPDTYGRPISPDMSLPAQCPWGYIDRTHQTRRRRFLHKHPDGAYHFGRHGTNHPHHYDPEMLLFWFGWAPFAHVKARILQIQKRMSARDRQAGNGWEHLVTEEELHRRWEQQWTLSEDLRHNPTYRRMMDNFLLTEDEEHDQESFAIEPDTSGRLLSNVGCSRCVTTLDSGYP